MATNTFRAALIAAALTIPAAVVAMPATAEAAPCPATMTFSISGVDGNPAWVPGVSGPRTNVHYRSDLHSVVTDPIGTRKSGERALTRSITQFRNRCPGSHVKVVGHSYGAWIAGNVRDTHPVRNSSYVLVSDPRAKMGVLRLVPSVPGFFEAQGPRRGKAKAPTATTCRTSDLVCWAPNPVADPVGFVNSAIGYATGDHAYSSREVRQAPGTRIIRGPNHVQIPAVAPVQAPAPVVRQAPPPPPPPAPVRVEQYVPKEIVQHVPREIRNVVVPKEITNLIPPLPKF